MKLPKLFAHRGGRAWAPENTLSAFSKSLELGVDGIELDVQRCATGELVVFHDEELSRTTNGVGLIRDCTFDELRKLSAGQWYDDAFRNERIPSLQEVLDLINGQCILNIELKNTPIGYDGIDEDLLSVIESYPHQDQLIISSFDHKLLLKLHQNAPHLQLAILGAAVFLDLKELATKLGAGWFHPAFDCLRPDIVEEAHAAGLTVNVWTCNTPAEWRHCIRMSIDGIMTDDPSLLKQYLHRYVEQPA